jgi:hypothetical protein
MAGSQADELFDWESLVAAGRKNVAQMPDIETVLAPLEGIIDEVKTLKVHQKDLEGNRQATTQRLKELRLRGVEEARRLRDYVRSRLGSKNEHLVQFGVVPLRRRSRSKPAEFPPPVDPDKTAEG